MNVVGSVEKIRTVLFRGCKAYMCLKPEANRRLHEKLRAADARHYLYRQPDVVRIPIKILIFLLWPIRAFRSACRHYLVYSGVVKQECGTGKARQFIDQLYLAWFEFIPCRYYYQFHLFDDARMKRRNTYLLHRNNNSLFAALNGFDSGEIINNKVMFSRFCVDNNIPAPKTLAGIEKGTVTLVDDIGAYRNIVIKPVSGHMGRGVKYARIENGVVQYENKSLSMDRFMQQIANESQVEPSLIQERLYSHPEIRAISNDYLASIRIVTYLNDNALPAYLAALLLLPHDAITISNEGRIYPIKAETGEILPPVLLPFIPEYRNSVAEASRIIAGHCIPYWDEAKQLVLKTHRLLPGYFSLGWDIAITSDGPVILETNIGWDTDLIQYYHDLPLIETDFSRCAVARLDRLKNISALKIH